VRGGSEAVGLEPGGYGSRRGADVDGTGQDVYGAMWATAFSWPFIAIDHKLIGLVYEKEKGPRAKKQNNRND